MSVASIASIIVGTIVIIVGIVLGWYVFPGMVETQIGESVALINDTTQFDRFEELPLAFDFKVYIFNVKNEVDASQGKKPIMEEKGPYIYKQTRRKQNITWDNTNQISYYEYQNYEFNQEASGKLKDTDPILVVHPALNSAIQIMEMSLPVLLSLLEGKVTYLAFNTEDIYLRTTVKEFLFDGVPICDMTRINAATDLRDKYLAIIVCMGLYVMPAKNIRAVDDKLMFTFLNHKNITHDGHYTVNNGIKDKKQLANIEKWQDKETLEFWGEKNSTCNKLHGRDAVIFPPFIKDDSVLTVFNTDICRTIDLHYSEEVTVRDTISYEFILPEDTFSAPDEEFGNECYCLNTTKGITYDNGCSMKGVMELFTCYNAPIILSFPHFLWADDNYKYSVSGLEASIEKHKTFVQLEPNTGTPLGGSKRVQFNMYLRKVDNIDYLQQYETTRLIPILWLDEHVEINDKLFDELYYSYIEKTIIIDGVTWGIIAIGIVVVVVTLGVTIWKNKKAKEMV